MASGRRDDDDKRPDAGGAMAERLSAIMCICWRTREKRLATICFQKAPNPHWCDGARFAQHLAGVC